MHMAATNRLISCLLEIIGMDRHDITSRYGVQGGFFVVRPSESMIQTIVSTVVRGHYNITKGLNCDGYGGYPGAAQISGFLSFMFSASAVTSSSSAGAAVELDRCVYSNMQDSPYIPTGPGWQQVRTTLAESYNAL